MNLWTADPRSPSLIRWVAALALMALTGCDRSEVRVYRVAKEVKAQPAIGAHDHQDHSHETRGGGLPRLTWTLPSGWEELPASEMRLASFKVVGDQGKQADIGVFPLPGLAGGDLGNVNRWRSQVGLEAVNEVELEKLAEPVQIDGLPAKLYDQAGENPSSGDQTRILAAILHREGVAWFFKMNGDDEVVAAQKEPFTAFLKSLKFNTTQPDLPPDHPPIDGMSMAAQVSGTPSGQPKPEWQVPSGWREISGGPFLVAKFALPDDPQAAVNVSMSAGDGGGVAGNVNRWRKQLGLTELSESDINQQLKTVETAGGDALFVEIEGADPKSGQKTSVIGAIVPQPNRTWFFKLTGSQDIVNRQKDAFTQFVKTARYPAAS